jgi:hypothetical protein
MERGRGGEGQGIFFFVLEEGRRGRGQAASKKKQVRRKADKPQPPRSGDFPHNRLADLRSRPWLTCQLPRNEVALGR